MNCSLCKTKGLNKQISEFWVLTSITGEKPYKCDGSDKRETRQVWWLWQERNHTSAMIGQERNPTSVMIVTGEKKPYKCDDCDRRRNPTSVMNVTGEKKPYKCDGCHRRETLPVWWLWHPHRRDTLQVWWLRQFTQKRNPTNARNHTIMAACYTTNHTGEQLQSWLLAIQQPCNKPQ